MKGIDIFLPSLKQFFAGQFKRVWLWGPAVLLDPFDFYERYLQLWFPPLRRIDYDISPVVFLVIWVVLWSISAVLTYHELNVKVRPMLEIVFDAEEPDYLQSGQGGLILFPIERPRYYRLYRVGVRNLGTQAIKNVTLKLESITPEEEHSVFLPISLRITHDHETPRLQEFVLRGGETRRIDVISEHYYAGHPADLVQIETASKAVHVHISPGERRILTLVAYGYDVLESPREFVVDWDSENRLLFRPLDTA